MRDAVDAWGQHGRTACEKRPSAAKTLPEEENPLVSLHTANAALSGLPPIRKTAGKPTVYRLYPFRRQTVRSLAVEHRAGCPCLPYARTCQFRPVAGFLFARLENAGSLQRRQGDELAPLHDGRRDKVFVEGVDMFPFRTHVADGGGRRGWELKPGFGTRCRKAGP